MELTGEGGLIGIAAFLGDHADRRVGSPQTIASAFDSRPRQILSGGKTEQSANALIELEHRQSRALGEIGNSQRRVEVVVDIGERRRQRGDVRARARQIRDVPRDAGKPDDFPPSIGQRLLPGQAPAMASAGVKVQFQSPGDRDPVAQDAPILIVEAGAERRGKDLPRGPSDQIGLISEIAASNQRVVDRDIAGVPIFEKEDRVRDAVEQLFAEKRAAERSEKILTEIDRRFHGRGYCADSRFSARDSGKTGEAAGAMLIVDRICLRRRTQERAQWPRISSPA